ncbi:hypothetical protein CAUPRSCDRAFT_12334 [Caulochytrium protostelioides]|uniref:Uncharacterized protein n=1 Tax=Caulochytrium protostelioides TaxID=1555241 RepID=A0A4P9WS47_9FUNG|nr:hypothetical protein CAUPRSCDRAFT_12334 [Caulochytrium protostelioides]
MCVPALPPAVPGASGPLVAPARAAEAVLAYAARCYAVQAYATAYDACAAGLRSLSTAAEQPHHTPEPGEAGRALADARIALVGLGVLALVGRYHRPAPPLCGRSPPRPRRRPRRGPSDDPKDDPKDDPSDDPSAGTAALERGFWEDAAMLCELAGVALDPPAAAAAAAAPGVSAPAVASASIRSRVILRVLGSAVAGGPRCLRSVAGRSAAGAGLCRAVPGARIARIDSGVDEGCAFSGDAVRRHARRVRGRLPAHVRALAGPRDRRATRPGASRRREWDAGAGAVVAAARSRAPGPRGRHGVSAALPRLASGRPGRDSGSLPRG